MHEMYHRRVALAFGMPEDTDSDVLAARVDEERERRAALTAKGDWRTRSAGGGGAGVIVIDPLNVVPSTSPTAGPSFASTSAGCRHEAFHLSGVRCERPSAARVEARRVS
jgi:hypothetical protein